MRSALSRRAIVAAALLASLGASYEAHAAGLYFSDRGVRPLGRGGAFVAGADDLGSIWYNPAGIADAGTSVLADFSWLHFTSSFTRQSLATTGPGAGSVTTFPTVNGSSPILPIPTIAASYAFGEKKEYTIAGGIYAPMTAITSYPETVPGPNGALSPAPSRYSLVSLDGSALVVIGGFFAYKPVEQFQIGAGLQMLTGTFKSTVNFSANPADRVISAPEDPKYDAFSQLNVGPIFAPSGNIGVTVTPVKQVRIGLSGQLPFAINAPATVNVRLPNAVEFDKASQDGNSAHVKFKLPAIFRVGVEVRPTDELRVELAYVREFWSNHSSIDIVPDNIKLLNVTGFPSPFAVNPISIPRNFQDSNSVRLGGEYRLHLGEYDLDLRAGVNYEKSAVPNPYLSVLTIDLDKITLALGGGIHIGKHWRLDAVYAHVFASDTVVTPQEAAVPRVSPVKGNPTATEAVNGGSYSATADVLGIGLNYKF